MLGVKSSYRVATSFNAYLVDFTFAKRWKKDVAALQLSVSSQLDF